MTLHRKFKWAICEATERRTPTRSSICQVLANKLLGVLKSAALPTPEFTANEAGVAVTSFQPRTTLHVMFAGFGREAQQLKLAANVANLASHVGGV